MLALPSLAARANIDASLRVAASYTTNTDSQFDVVINNFTPNGSISVLTIVNSAVSDIKSAYFLDKSGWVVLTPYQNDSNVLAKFISDTGFDSNGQRVITLRINFNTPKTYVIGFTLQNSDGQTISSAASPLTVSGPQVLGATTTATTDINSAKVLKIGMSGSDVKALQNKLASLGLFAGGSVSGYFGKFTQSSVKKFQTMHGIPADGIVGPATQAALNKQ